MLNFDNVFFRDEVREGFYVSSMMKRCWAVEISVLKEIIDICERNNVRIFVDFGTLLGAVRHKGFIPWDDDLDICVLRADLPAFEDAMDRDLPNGWELLKPDSQEKKFMQPWYRVINKFGFMLSDKELEKFYGFRYPEGIDVFILDHIAPTEDEIEVVAFVYDLMKQICYGNKLLEPEDLENRIKALEEVLNIKITRGSMKEIKSVVMELTMSLVGAYTSDDSDILIESTSLPYAKKRYDPEWFKEAVYLPFENIMVPAPLEYTKVLETTYRDYLKKKRGTSTHGYPSYIKNEKAFETQTGENHRYFVEKKIITDNPCRRYHKDKNRIIFFLPYTVESWEYMDDAYRKAISDETNQVFVMPIPYFEKHYSGKLEKEICENTGYPEHVKITKLSEINIEAYDIDEIYVQQPYDERNLAISVHPYFYSKKLRQMCRQLIYIQPFKLLEFDSKDDVCYKTFEYFASMPGVVYADKVIVHSENTRNWYIEFLSEWAGEETMAHWERKIFREMA